MMKYLHKFFNHFDLPWVKLIWDSYYSNAPPQGTLVGSFRWKSVLKLLPQFKSVASCKVENGSSVLLWSDKWSDDTCLSMFPELHSFAIREDITVRQACHLEELEALFHRPLSLEAFAQFQQLQALILSTHLSASKDVWSYSWASKNFLPSLMYKSLKFEPPAHPLFKMLWKCAVILRYKVFFWLLLHDRLNTRDLLQRKSFWLSSYSCAICASGCVESAMHLFWDCPFALDCWNIIIPSRSRSTSVLFDIQLAARVLRPEFHMDIIVMGCWNIWTERNNWIFTNMTRSIKSWKELLRQDLEKVCIRIKDSRQDAFRTWIVDNL